MKALIKKLDKFFELITNDKCFLHYNVIFYSKQNDILINKHTICNIPQE